MSQFRKKLIYGAILLTGNLVPFIAQAQGLTISGGGTTSLLPPGFGGYVLIAFRLLLVFLLLYAGMIAYRAGFNWMYWEGNAIKADESKKTLAKSLVFITMLFIILLIFRAWIGGDYSTLVL